MVNTFLGIVSFSICVFIAFNKVNENKKNIEVLNYFVDFNRNLKINLEHKKLDLIKFVKSYDKDNVILKSYLKQINKSQLNFELIKNEKIKILIENYFSGLGKSNTKSQIEYVELYSEILEKELYEYKVLGDKKIKLYPKIGIFSGLIFLIILI